MYQARKALGSQGKNWNQGHKSPAIARTLFSVPAVVEDVTELAQLESPKAPPLPRHADLPEYLAVQALIEAGFGTPARSLSSGMAWLGLSAEDAQAALLSLVKGKLLDYTSSGAAVLKRIDWAQHGKSAAWFRTVSGVSIDRG